MKLPPKIWTNIGIKQVACRCYPLKHAIKLCFYRKSISRYATLNAFYKSYKTGKFENKNTMSQPLHNNQTKKVNMI